MSAPSSATLASSARSMARRLAVQALYRWQLNDCPWQDLIQEFASSKEAVNADPEYFELLIKGVCAARAELDQRLAGWLDRKPQLLDPIEHAVLLIAVYELMSQPEVPWRVAINEAVGLARRFGATDGHKYVNAVLDRAARELRPQER